MQFDFLNTALADFQNAIQTVWAPVLQQQGVNILLALSVLAFLVQAIELVKSEDLAQFLLGLTFSVTSIAVLYAVFLNSQNFASAVYEEFLYLAQRMTGESPYVLTPSGIAEQGLILSRIFWDAGSKAAWYMAPIVDLEILGASLAVVLAFGIAGIIYLLAIIEVTSLIVGGLLLLAFAASPWTWEIFPGWGLRVLSACFKIFFLIAVLALGMKEAQGWANHMTAWSGSFANNLSYMLQITIEALLFLGCVYYLPGLFASMVAGGTGAVMTAGEAMLGSMGGATAGAAGGAIAAGGGALAARGANAAVAMGSAVSEASKTVSTMLFR